MSSNAKRDYYEVLGVKKDSSADEVRKAYRKVAFKFHPDRNPGDKAAEESFKEATEAYEVLSDEQKRKLYDAYGHAGLSGQGFRPPEDIFEQFQDLFADFFGGGGGGFGGGGVGVAVEGDDDPNPGDFQPVEELPQLVTMPNPVYPAMAREAQLEGVVKLMVLVGKDGKVKNVKVEQSIQMLDDAAKEAAMQAVFKPATWQKKPVAVWVSVPIRFTLRAE